jgi:hypothetical protein
VDAVLVGLGVVVLAITFVDITLTTVALSSGKGPLTGQLARGIWWTFLRVTSRFQSRNVLALGGPAVQPRCVQTGARSSSSRWSARAASCCSACRSPTCSRW